MVEAANKLAGLEIDPKLLASEAEASGESGMQYWANQLSTQDSPVAKQLSAFSINLLQSRVNWKSVVTESLKWLPGVTDSESGVASDAAEDKAAWEKTARDLRTEKGDQLELAELLQGLALRPKDPPPDPDAVTLLTIHSSKGLEFENVWLAGLAETVLPSWQSLKTDASPADMEEERRNCFVAITRTRSCLHLSCAHSYQGYTKKPSRFMSEMGLAN